MTGDELRAYGLSRTDSLGSIPAGNSVAKGGDFKTLEKEVLQTAGEALVKW
jgi:hypothetical protein